MGRRRPRRNVARAAFHSLDSPPADSSLLSVDDYVARVQSDKDPVTASVSVLREVALNLSTTAIIVDSIYHQLLLEKLCTVTQLKQIDPYLVKFLDKNKQKNCFREFRLQCQMVDMWELNWEVHLGFAQVPCRDILETCVQVAQLYTMEQTLAILKINGRRTDKEGNYRNPTKAELTAVVRPELPTSSDLKDAAPLRPTRSSDLEDATSTRSLALEDATSPRSSALEDGTPFRRTRSSLRSPPPIPEPQRSQPSRKVRKTEVRNCKTRNDHPRASKRTVGGSTEALPPTDADLNRIAAEVFQGRPYRTLRIGQTLKEKIDQKHNDHDDYLWPGGEIIHGNILILSCDGHIMGIKVDPSPPPTSWVQQLTKGFECLRRTWAHKRKANTTYVAEDLDARRTGSEANAKSTGKTVSPPAPPPNADPLTIEKERQRLLKRRRDEVVTSPLPAPLPCDHRHHDFEVMRKAYGHSRCGVFHFAYWIPVGQNKEGPCPSADTCPPSYRHTAVARFLKSTWAFRAKPPNCYVQSLPRLNLVIRPPSPRSKAGILDFICLGRRPTSGWPSFITYRSGYIPMGETTSGASLS